MTFSITARCPQTGMYGVAVTSSSPAVAARCAWARAGVGAVATQNITDPELGPKGLDLMAEGLSAPEALERLLEGYAFADYRQLALVDRDGHVAHHSGTRTLGRHAVAVGPGVVAAGNLLAHNEVPAAMLSAFATADYRHLAERLVSGLEAGLADGGEEGPVRSAGVVVVDKLSWPVVDLRIDWHENPIHALREAWTVYEPQAADYVTRALDPSVAPSYGVPGDL